MTDNPALDKLKELIQFQGSQDKAAALLDISPALLSRILKGEREISTDLAEKLGFRRVNRYEIVLDAKGYGDQFGALYKRMDEEPFCSKVVREGKA